MAAFLMKYTKECLLILADDFRIEIASDARKIEITKAIAGSSEFDEQIIRNAIEQIVEEKNRKLELEEKEKNRKWELEEKEKNRQWELEEKEKNRQREMEERERVTQFELEKLRILKKAEIKPRGFENGNYLLGNKTARLIENKTNVFPINEVSNQGQEKFQKGNKLNLKWHSSQTKSVKDNKLDIPIVEKASQTKVGIIPKKSEDIIQSKNMTSENETNEIKQNGIEESFVVENLKKKISQVKQPANNEEIIDLDLVDKDKLIEKDCVQNTSMICLELGENNSKTESLCLETKMMDKEINIQILSSDKTFSEVVGNVVSNENQMKGNENHEWEEFGELDKPQVNLIQSKQENKCNNEKRLEVVLGLNSKEKNLDKSTIMVCLNSAENSSKIEMLDKFEKGFSPVKGKKEFGKFYDAPLSLKSFKKNHLQNYMLADWKSRISEKVGVKKNNYFNYAFWIFLFVKTNLDQSLWVNCRKTNKEVQIELFPLPKIKTYKWKRKWA